MKATKRGPSLERAPSFFRYGVIEAATRKVIGIDPETGEPKRADYSIPGWHLAIHVEEYLSEEALEELGQIPDRVPPRRFGQELLAFLEREFPACMALVPRQHRRRFLRGVWDAIDQGRFAVHYDVSLSCGH